MGLEGGEGDRPWTSIGICLGIGGGIGLTRQQSRRGGGFIQAWCKMGGSVQVDAEGSEGSLCWISSVKAGERQ